MKTLLPCAMLFEKIPVYALEQNIFTSTIKKDLKELSRLFSDAYKYATNQEIDVVYLVGEERNKEGKTGIDRDVSFPNLIDGALFIPIDSSKSANFQFSIICGVGLAIAKKYEDLIFTAELEEEKSSLDDPEYCSDSLKFFLLCFSRYQLKFNDAFDESTTHTRKTLKKIEYLLAEESEALSRETEQ